MSHIVPLLNDCGKLAYIWIWFDILELKDYFGLCAREVQCCHIDHVNFWCDIMDSIVIDLDWKYRCLWKLFENVGIVNLWPSLDFLTSPDIW